MKKQQLIEEINKRESAGDVTFVDIYTFQDSKDYSSASFCRGCDLEKGEWSDDIRDIAEVKEYNIIELTREEYALTLSNSSTTIDEVWSEEDADMKALLVLILR